MLVCEKEFSHTGKNSGSLNLYVQVKNLILRFSNFLGKESSYMQYALHLDSSGG